MASHADVTGGVPLVTLVSRRSNMGAWGEDPMQNDTALDWLRARVEEPLAATIDDTLAGYLKGTVRPAEAEAAVAVLVDYSGAPSGAKYRGIDIGPEAEERGLWDLAEEVVGRLLADSAWIDSWLDPATKIEALRSLLDDVKGRARVGQ
jgi:hypothetical protein